MKAEETTFKELVQGEKQFQIPIYQRTYSWQPSSQLSRLWDDIREQADGLDGDATQTSHFIGSVVLAPGVVTPKVARWIVVDGQQRLTTLMLAMCAIRDHRARLDPAQRERLDEIYLVNRWQEGDLKSRLLPTKADRGSFQACLDGRPDAGGADNVGAAYRFFREQLAAYDDPEDPLDVDRIEQVISDHLSLVAVTADRQDNVHRIFESLNNTGMDLTQADLVRNLVFMLLPTQADVVYDTVWLPMQRRLTPDQLEDLLYLYLVLHGQDRIRRDALYQGVQRALEPGRASEESVKAFVNELDRRAVHLRRLVAPDEEPDPRLRAAFRRLNVWGAQIAQPALMLLLDRQAKGGATTDEVVSAVGYVESFLVRRMICGVPTNNLNRVFNAFVTQLPEAMNVAEGTRQVLSRERSFWPDDDELRRSIESRPFYWQGRPAQKQLILRRLEESYPSAERVDLDRAALTIEHVLPQTPSSEWLEMLGVEVEPGESAEDLHKRLVHALGNLTLTGYNVELSNHPFERKQELLRHSNLEMNRPIAATERWGKAEIMARAGELADRAIKIWPAPLPGAAYDSGRDWSSLHKVMAALPLGSWTTYGELAALIGSHPVPVGQHLGTVSVPNGHRALRNDGTISPGFRWIDPTDTRDVGQVLREEGCGFLADGAADPSQRLSASDLAILLGLDTDELSEARGWDVDPIVVEDGHRRFIAQLTERQGPDVSAAVQRLLDDWRALGCWLEFGTAAITGCNLLVRRERAPWPVTLYPYGAEVVFQHMAKRPPFDDAALRNEFRERLNLAPGVSISEAKLSLRPSFPMHVLANAAAYGAIVDALRWFVGELRA